MILGEVATIRETMLGKDQNGFYTFVIKVDGNVPVFDGKKNLIFEDYIHTYRYDSLGIMTGYYTSTFNIGEKTTRFRVVEVLEFKEVQGCLSLRTSKMTVSEQRSSYLEETGVFNFALKTEMEYEGESST